DRIGSGPAAYIRGRELLASEIDANVLSGIPGDFLALRAHPGILEINATSIPVIVVAVVNYHAGTGTDPYPIGARDVSLDSGLRATLRPPEPCDPGLADRRDRTHAGGRPPRRGLRGPRPLPAGRRPGANEGGPPDMIRPRAFAGLALCAFLLGATWPVLAALP